MDLKKTQFVALMAVLWVSGWAGAGLLMRTDFITAGNIDKMGATAYTPRNDYDFRFVKGAAGISDGSDFDAVRSAFGTWVGLDNADLSVREITASAGFTPGTKNGYNDVSWIAPGYGYSNPWRDLLGYSSQTIAVVVTWYSSWSGQVKERDMYFNDVDFDWRTDTAGAHHGGFHVEHIALHEAGHIYGLKDVYNPGQPGWEAWMGSGNESLTMYGYSSWDNDDVTLSPVDIAAIGTLFPAAVPEPNAAILFLMAGGLLFVTRKP